MAIYYTQADNNQITYMEKDIDQASYTPEDQNLTESWINSEQMKTLPPEVQDKVQAALRKLGNNPSIMNMIKMGMDMSKEASKNGGVYVKTFTVNNDQPATTSTVSESPQIIQPTNNTRRQPSMPITFNPDVKNDHWRRQIFIVGLLILIGYLVYKYGAQFGLNF